MKKNKCPNCDGVNILPIIYGLPTAEAFEQDGKNFHLGGCVVEQYKYYCKDCENEFGEDGLLEMLNELLKSYSVLETEQPDYTFMQLAGYPHYENVCSNLLCFFFDTREAHGFKDLFVRSLLECIPQIEHLQSYTTNDVERECVTENNNRIDLVIETDTFTVGIENKIFSGVQNDLNDYEDCIKSRAGITDTKPICVLLSLEINNESTGNTSFISISYPQLIEQVKMNLGQYLVSAEAKWIVFLSDFIRTIEGFQEETKLDKEILSFFSENWNEIAKLLEAKSQVERFLKDEAKKVKELVNISEDAPVKQYVYGRKDCSAGFYVEFNSSKSITGTITLEIYFDCDQHYLLVSVNGDSNIQKKILEKHLKNNKITSSRWLNSDVHLEIETFDVYESKKTIADKFNDILNIVLKA